MTQINDELISSVAKLARLDFSVEERKRLADDMRDMISFAENINSLSEKTLSESESFCDLREDEVLPSTDREKLLSSAPYAEGAYIKVPRVVDAKEDCDE